jgi:hypothetical protein
MATLDLKQSISRSPLRYGLLFMAFGCAWCTLSPVARAVVPPPDGGYPNFTTAEGNNALKNLTTGAANTALGWYSLFSDTDGSFNTATGAGSLLFNTGNSNTAIGAASLLFNGTGTDNTAVGTAALLSNTASGNTAIGSNALLNNTTGGTLGNIQGFDVGPNVAVGWQALESNTVASANTALGSQALHSFTTGPVGLEQLGLCTAVGFQALGNATGGAGNSGFGYQTLFNNTDGTGNSAIGAQVLFNNTTGTSNTASGGSALFNNTIGDYNTATGGRALYSNVTGESNTAIGQQALQSNISGSDNTAVGLETLVSNTNGSHNIALGDGAGTNVMTADRVICIGAVGDDVSNSCFIGQIFNVISAGGTPVFINSNNKLGTITSSRRFKEQIKPMEQASEVLFALKPVSFRYKKELDPTGISQFGLVAEEVEKVNPDLVVRDKEGKAYIVRYDQVNAMLLNEFLKEHRKVEKLEVAVAQQCNDFQATITELKKEMESIIARSKEQDAKIETVSAQIELNKLAPQKLANK